MSSKPQKNVGYTMKNSNKGGQGDYQTPSAQNDSTHVQEGEDNVSLFDIRKAGHPVASLFTFTFKLVGILRYSLDSFQNKLLAICFWKE